MTYPETVDRFVEKLNKADTVYVIEDEELILENGVFEGELAHDNVKNDSVMVFTGPNMTGERIQNFFLSIPSDAPWKRIIKVFTNAPKVYVTYETEGDQVEAEDINRVQDSIVNTQIELERYKSVNDLAVSDLGTRLSTVESKKADKTYVDTELLKKADKENIYTKAETDSRIQAIIGAAPEALDTLAEIAEALNNDPDFAATITNLLAQKVDKVAGMGLSEANFTNEEKTKLSTIEEGANKYIHPSTHPASMIVETSEKRFVSDIEKAAWNAKETPAGAQEKANAAETNAKTYADSIKPTKVSQLENDRGYVTQEELGDAGYGDMLKAVYDTNNDGIVDNADKLDGKHASDFALASHTHTADAITGNLETTKLTEPSYVAGNVTITAKPLFDVLRADRTAFLPASQIIIEKSIDGGVTWEDAGISDANKAKLFTGQRPSITIPRKDGKKNTDCMLRITITGMKYNVPDGTAETAKYNYWNSNYVIARERYFLAEDAWLWVNTNADRIYCKVERATGGNSNNWITVREVFLSGWPGGNYIKLGFNFGGGTSQTGNNWNWRFTFRTATTSDDFDNAKLNQTYITSSQTIHHIKISGRNVHNSSNNLMYHDHLYTWDENQNAIFPANVTASDFYVGSNKVWHAGNFDPDTKLNKGPITWNQLKGVI